MQGPHCAQLAGHSLGGAGPGTMGADGIPRPHPPDAKSTSQARVSAALLSISGVWGRVAPLEKLCSQGTRSLWEMSWTNGARVQWTHRQVENGDSDKEGTVVTWAPNHCNPARRRGENGWTL